MRNFTKYIPVVIVSVLLAACQGRRGEMMELLELAEELNVQDCPMDTVAFMDEVLDYFTKHGSADEQMRANYIMGRVFHDRGDSPMALQYYLEAVQSDDTSRTGYNFQKASRIYGQMATIYHQQNYPQKELEAWQMAANMAHRANDSLMNALCIDKMSGAYLFMNDTVNAMQCAKSAYTLFKEQQRENYAAAMSALFIDYYLFRDSLEEAKDKIDEYMRYSNHVDKQGRACRGSEIFYYYQGLYYEKLGKLDSAQHFYRKLSHYSANIMNAEGSYRGLMSVYAKLHEPDSVEKYAKLYAAANDTANMRNTAKDIVRMEKLYNYSEHQLIARQKAEEANTLLNTMYIGVISVLIVAVFVAIVIRRRIARERQIALQKELERQTIKKKLTVALHDLSAVKEDKAEFEKRKQKEFDDLKRLLAMEHDEAFDLSQYEAEVIIKDVPIFQRVQLCANCGKVLTASEIRDLTFVIEKYLPTFYEKLMLQSQSISYQCICVCILSRLGFPPSRIAALLGLSKQHVSNLRTSANKKLFGENSTKQFDYNIKTL